jgi:hypothetical protein
MRGLLRSEQPGTVLVGVKATPCGWPTASLDPGCGRRRTTTGEAAPQKNGQDPLNSSLYGSRGLPPTARTQIEDRVGAVVTTHENRVTYPAAQCLPAHGSLRHAVELAAVPRNR